ncbi:hypothetical protein EYF80_021023 [Liparis tanakae]|uniref:Uncharacterized protein n=1 Tax=Liparis tanakae TaxID=230148 RepID=A0A4Z2HT36_9TELE|nr:hypothetical protein EYF80_021023 [Liparis tanakae]
MLSVDNIFLHKQNREYIQNIRGRRNIGVEHLYANAAQWEWTGIILGERDIYAKYMLFLRWGRIVLAQKRRV